MATGLAYNTPALVTRPVIVAGVAVAIVLAAIQAATRHDLPVTLAQAIAIVAAGVAFWPKPAAVTGHAARWTLARPLPALVDSARGARLLALSLLAWGALQVGFLLPLPAGVIPALLRVAGLLQGLRALALVVLVVDRARRRAEFRRAFSQTLLDGMDVRATGRPCCSSW